MSTSDEQQPELPEFQPLSPLQWYDRQQKLAWLETCWNKAYRCPTSRSLVQDAYKMVSHPIAGIEGGAMVEFIAPEPNQNPLQAWLVAMWLFP